MAAPEIRIFSDLNQLSNAAASFFCDTAVNAIEGQGYFSCVLSGGSTPAKLYGVLAEGACRQRIPWDRVYLFWGDERCVAPDDPESNYNAAFQKLIRHVAIPQENIHRMMGELPASAAVQDYTRQLADFAASKAGGGAFPAFDLVILGLGEDGHIASIFPGSEETGSPVASVTADYQGRPAGRITLTPPVFNHARQILFLVAGENKQEALFQSIFSTPDPVRWPAQRIHPHSSAITWMVDRSAAGALPERFIPDF